MQCIEIDLGTHEPYHIGDRKLFSEDLYKEFFKYFKSKADNDMDINFICDLSVSMS